MTHEQRQTRIPGYRRAVVGCLAAVLFLAANRPQSAPASGAASPGGYALLGAAASTEDMLWTGFHPTIVLDEFGGIYSEADVEEIAPKIANAHTRGQQYMTYYSFGHSEDTGNHFPDLQELGKVVDLDGNSIEANVGGNLLSITRSYLRDTLRTLTLLAVDAGADYAVYDVAFANPWPLESGSFDSDAMADFRAYLAENHTQAELETMFAQTVDAGSFDYGDYLRSLGLTASTVGGNPVVSGGKLYASDHWQAWRTFNAQLEADFFSTLATESQAHAQSTYGKDFGVVFNRYGHFSRPGARWVSAPYAAFDSGETYFGGTWNYDQRKTLEPLYRANLKTHGNRYWSWNDPPQSSSGNDIASVFLAEAFANGGIPQCQDAELTRDNSRAVAAFAAQHPETLGHTPVADIAVLYPLPTIYDWVYGTSVADAEKHYSYLGTGYLLADAHWNYDVVFAGDNTHIADTFSLADIQEYNAVLLAETTRITDSQFAVLSEYVTAGGTLLVVGASVARYDKNGADRAPERGMGDVAWSALFVPPGSTAIGAGTVKVLTNSSIMTWYYSTTTSSAQNSYRDTWEGEISGSASAALSTTLNERVHVGRFRDADDGSEFYHLVNYNFNTNKIVQEQSGYEITLPIPPNYTGATVSVSFMSLDVPEPVVLETVTNTPGGTVSVTLPAVPIWGIVKVGSVATPARNVDYAPYAYLHGLFDYEQFNNQTTRTLNWTAADDNGLDSVQLYYRFSDNGVDYGSWTAGPTASAADRYASGTIDFPLSEEGAYQLQLLALDTAGQIEPLSDAFVETLIGFDQTPPDFSTILVSEESGVENGGFVTAPFTPSFTWNDVADVSGIFGYHYYFGRDGNVGFVSDGTDAAVTFAAIEEGNYGLYQFALRAQDNANLWTEVTVVFEFTYTDGIVPTPTNTPVPVGVQDWSLH